MEMLRLFDAPTTRLSDCASPRTTATSAVRAREPETRIVVERQLSEPQQINRRNPLHMIAKEGLPGLQWPISPRHHIDRNRGLGDLDAELKQLTMDLGGAPH